MDSWDDWLGQLALVGVDPRTWDLNQMLAAFEAAIRQSAKDESEWRRTQAKLTAEPKEVREQRKRDAQKGRKTPGMSRMNMADAEALMARFAVTEAMYR